jgi:ribosomal protein L37E
MTASKLHKLHIICGRLLQECFDMETDVDVCCGLSGSGARRKYRKAGQSQRPPVCIVYEYAVH